MSKFETVDEALKFFRNLPHAVHPETGEALKAPLTQAEFSHVENDASVSPETLAGLLDGSIVSFADCPSDLVQSLNRWALANVAIFLGEFSVPTLVQWSGIEEVKPNLIPAIDDNGQPVLNKDGQPVMTIDPASDMRVDFSVSLGRKEGKRNFRAKYHSNNRKLREESAKALSLTIGAYCWAMNGETFIFDSQGLGASCNHRSSAAKIAELQGFAGTLPLMVVCGVPAIFVNTIDTGRSRTAADTQYRDPSILPPESLTDIDGKAINPAKLAEYRQKLAKTLSSVETVLYHRLNGADVNASMSSKGLDTTSKNGVLYKILRGFDGLEELTALAYNADIGRSGVSSWGKIISPHYVVAGLALWFGKDMGIADPMTLEPLSVGIDLEACKGFLSELETASTAPTDFGRLWGVVAEAKRLEPREKFGTVLNLISYHFTGEYVSRTKSESNPIPHASCWLGKGERATKENPGRYPHLGGMDVPKGMRGDE